MQNQKKPIQQKKPMQNFTAEKWADKIALFIDNFGFLSGFFWHWTIALPSPTSHLAMLHSKIILSDPNRRVKVVLIGFSLFWSRCRTWGTTTSDQHISTTRYDVNLTMRYDVPCLNCCTSFSTSISSTANREGPAYLDVILWRNHMRYACFMLVRTRKPTIFTLIRTKVSLSWEYWTSRPLLPQKFWEGKGMIRLILTRGNKTLQN